MRLEKPWTFWILFALTLVVAAAFRFSRLDDRPMHTDESVQAVKTGALIDTGDYQYDPHQCHGPSLYYLALPFYWLSSASDFAETKESTFRMVPACCGLGLLLLLLLIRNDLGKHATLYSSVLTAVSTAMVFYSRYYVQETLLVFFTFGLLVAGWKYAISRKAGWAVLAGAFAGLMFASKETCILAYASMMLAGVANRFLGRFDEPAEDKKIPHNKAGKGDFPSPFHIALFLFAASLVSAALYSSFFKHPIGILDSVRSFGVYFNRGYSAGDHVHSWYYYLRILVYWKRGISPIWTESLIVFMAVLGCIAALARKNVIEGSHSFIRFLALHTIFLTIIYSCILYKTPWCMLSFLHGMILLAGVGSVVLIRDVPNRLGRVGVMVVLALAAANLAWQAYCASFKFEADTRNPYVYSTTLKDVHRLHKRIDDLSDVSPDGKGMLIKVISKDYWPIPWYLKDFKNVGYWSQPVDSPDASVIIASPEFHDEIQSRLQFEYQKEYYGLRPDVVLAVYIQKDLWDSFMAKRSGL